MLELDVPEVLIDGLTLAECPRWYEGALYFSDVKAGRALRLCEDGSVDELLQVSGEHVGGLGFLSDGQLLAVLQKRRAVVRVRDGGFELYSDLQGLTRFMVNDMITHAGFAYVSQPGFDVFDGRPEEGPEPTDLLFVGLAGQAQIAVSGLEGPNGMAVSSDGRTLYVAECGKRQIITFAIQVDGELTDHAVHAVVPGGAIPDGICLDDTGAVWAACPMSRTADGMMGPGVLRLAPDGRATHCVPMVPGRRAVACAFGGRDRDILYICTAEEVMGDEAFKPRLGRIESVQLNFKGAGLP